MTIPIMQVEDHNLLLDPIVAERELERIGNWKDAICKLAELFVEEKVHDVLAIRLIHRHHTLNPGEFMLEREGEHRRRKALITEVSRLDEHSLEELVPNVVALSGDRFEAIEYVRPDVLTDPARAMHAMANNHVMQKAKDIIASSGTKQVLGLGVLNKSFFGQGSDDEKMMEITDVDEFANVIYWVKKPDKSRKAIQTLWGLGFGETQPINMQSNVATVAFNTWNGISCGVYCYVYCESLSPGHGQFHEHLHAPSEY